MMNVSPPSHAYRTTIRPSVSPTSPLSNRTPFTSSSSNDFYGASRKRRRDSSLDQAHSNNNPSASRAGPSTISQITPTATTQTMFSSATSDAEDGEIDEDRSTSVLPTTLSNGRPPRHHGGFPPERVKQWYNGRNPDEPARPGILDDSVTVADYVEMQLLVLDFLIFGIAKEDLVTWAGIDRRLLVIIFAELNLRLPDNLTIDDVPPLPPNSAIPQSFVEKGFHPDSIPRGPPKPRSASPERRPLKIDLGRAFAQKAARSDGLLPMLSFSNADDASPSRNGQVSAHPPVEPSPTATKSKPSTVTKSEKMELLRAQLKKRKAEQARVTANQDTPPLSQASDSPFLPIPTLLTPGDDIADTQEPAQLSTTPTVVTLTLPAKPERRLNASSTVATPPSAQVDTSTPSTEPSPEEPARKPTRHDRLLQEKLARLRAVNAMRKMNKSPVPMADSPMVTATVPLAVSNSEAQEDVTPDTPLREVIMEDVQMASPVLSALSTPTASSSPSMALNRPIHIMRKHSILQQAPPPSPAGPSRLPVRSFTTDAVLGGRMAKRLRASDLMDIPHERPLLPALAYWDQQIVIDLSDDEDDEENELLEAAVEEFSKQSRRSPSAADSSSEDDQLADAFLGPLMDELASRLTPSRSPTAAESTGSKVVARKDVSDEIRKLKEQIARAEKRKLELMSLEANDGADSSAALSTRSSITPTNTEDAAMADVEERVQLSDAEVELDPDYSDEWNGLEDYVEDPVMNEELGDNLAASPENLTEVDQIVAPDTPPTSFEDLGDLEDHFTEQTQEPVKKEVYDDAEDVLTSPSWPAIAPSSPDLRPQKGHPNSIVQPSLTHWSTYRSPLGRCMSSSSDPTAATRIHYSGGLLDLMPLRVQVLNRIRPEKAICAFEVPNGGTCMDTTCVQAHLKDFEPSDEETAQYLANVLPDRNAGQWCDALSRVRRANAAHPQDLTSQVAEALRALGLR